jgi:hypothetical protein
MHELKYARQKYGSALDGLMEEAGDIKAQYLAKGGNPDDVISPERAEDFFNQGPSALMQRPAQQRQDGSIAAPYVPADVALELGLIEDAAVPAVTDSLKDNIHTVSSGTNPDGTGFAVGRTKDGQIVKVIK